MPAIARWCPSGRGNGRDTRRLTPAVLRNAPFRTSAQLALAREKKPRPLLVGTVQGHGPVARRRATL